MDKAPAAFGQLYQGSALDPLGQVPVGPIWGLPAHANRSAVPRWRRVAAALTRQPNNPVTVRSREQWGEYAQTAETSRRCARPLRSAAWPSDSRSTTPALRARSHLVSLPAPSPRPRTGHAAIAAAGCLDGQRLPRLTAAHWGQPQTPLALRGWPGHSTRGCTPNCLWRPAKRFLAGADPWGSSLLQKRRHGPFRGSRSASLLPQVRKQQPGARGPLRLQQLAPADGQRRHGPQHLAHQVQLATPEIQ